MKTPEANDLSFLQSDDFYHEIFGLIFDSDDFIPEETKERYENSASGERIQILLDLLANNILSDEVKNIKGMEISNGNIHHIKAFLELLLALSEIGRSEISNENKNETS